MRLAKNWTKSVRVISLAYEMIWPTKKRWREDTNPHSCDQLEGLGLRKPLSAIVRRTWPTETFVRSNDFRLSVISDDGKHTMTKFFRSAERIFIIGFKILNLISKFLINIRPLAKSQIVHNENFLLVFTPGWCRQGSRCGQKGIPTWFGMAQDGSFQERGTSQQICGLGGTEQTNSGGKAALAPERLGNG